MELVGGVDPKKADHEYVLNAFTSTIDKSGPVTYNFFFDKLVPMMDNFNMVILDTLKLLASKPTATVLP